LPFAHFLSEVHATYGVRSQHHSSLTMGSPAASFFHLLGNSAILSLLLLRLFFFCRSIGNFRFVSS